MRSRSLFRLLIACMTCAGVGSAMADEVYTAKMVRTQGLRKESVQLEIRIRERATQEDADALDKILDEEGPEGLMSALRAGNRGEARVTGGLPRTVGWVRVHPGENGIRLVIVTDRPIFFPSDEPEREQTDAVGVLVLELNDRGRGRGRLAEALSVDVTPEGVLQVQASRSAPIEIEDVQKVE